MSEDDNDVIASLGFTQLRILGTGDFATVHLVEKDGVESALKLSHRGTTADRDRIPVEAEALIALDDPSVPKFISSGEVDGRQYLLMSLAPGVTLQSELQRRSALGQRFGDMEVLDLLSRILLALAHVHGHRRVHRDVKPANIMVTPAGHVTLIDFGFCKEEGHNDIRLGDSFWRVGAARCSPPTKLASPGLARATHDVFAAGAIAYLLLTGRYPWTVTERESVGDLRQVMSTRSPLDVRSLNSAVREPVELLISEMLETRDAYQLDALGAIDRLQVARESLSQSPPNEAPDVARQRHPVRDPVHGDIRLTPYELSVLDTAEFQRLRWISQLGMSHLVYPGGTHTRFSHAVGCVHKVEEILTAVESLSGRRLPDDLRATTRLVALIHDITHIAYGHSIEDELGIFERHDENAARLARLVFDRDSGIGSVLDQTEVGRIAKSHLDPDASVHKNSAIVDLISGGAGADVLEYLDRDALMCGLSQRTDSAILRQFRLRTSSSGELRLVSEIYDHQGPRHDRMLAIEEVLRQRYALFLKVYTHKAKASATAMLGKSLTNALHPPKGGDEQISESEVEWLGDESLLRRLASVDRRGVSIHADALIRRRLFKAVYRTQLLAPDERTAANYDSRRTSLRSQGLFGPESRRAAEERISRGKGG